jgi:hypothetical protein
LHSSTNANKINQQSFDFKLNKLLYDSGENWNSLSLFGSNSPSSFLKKKQNFSIRLTNKQISFSGIIMLTYKKDFYLFKHFFIPSSNHNPSSSHDYYNLIQYNNIGEVGYKNNWLNIAISNGSEGWGSGNEINLALDEYSKSYDYLKISSDYGNIRVKYLHGYLETIEDNLNRYITARGIEWVNKKSLILGFSETIIYSGNNRSLDFSYLNPISSHVEIELNDRLNKIGSSGSNAVWQFHLDFLIREKLRFSLNYLIDEFVFDRDIEIGKEHGLGSSVRISYVTIDTENRFISFIFKNTFIGTPTLRHSNGSNNFILNNHPLGWKGGSDSKEYSFGINYTNKKSTIFKMETGLTQSGEENIKRRSYDGYKDYQAGTFPSGKIEKSWFLLSKLEFWTNKKFNVSLFLKTEDQKENLFLLTLKRKLF